MPSPSGSGKAQPDAKSSSQSSKHGTFPDPTQTRTYPVLIGASLQKKTGGKRPVHASVRFNHKPAQSTTKRTTVMEQNPNKGSEYKMRIMDEDGKAGGTYTYLAQRVPKNSYALVYEPAKRAFVLEKVGANINCNLTATPRQSDPAALQKQYEQLEMVDLDGMEAGGEGLFSDSDEESSSEEDNPFDHRHWLDDDAGSLESSPRGGAVPTVSPIPQPTNVTSSATGSPAIRPVRLPPPSQQSLPKSPYRDDADDESSQIVERASGQLKTPPAPRAAPPPAKPHARRAPQTTSPLKKPKREPTRPSRPSKPSKPDDDLVIEFDPLPSTSIGNGPASSQTVVANGPPSVRSDSPDHEADAAGSNDDNDDDDLIIEMEPDTRPKRGLGMGLGISGSGAPMSLGSVASPLSVPVTQSSPIKENEAEQYWDPEQEQEEEQADAEEEQEEQEEQNEGEEELEAEANEELEEEEEMDEEEEEEDPHADSDVEADLELPPPVLQQTYESDQEDLEAELAQALASDPTDEQEQDQDQPPPPPPAVVASNVESESEEE